MIRTYAMARAKCILAMVDPEMVPELQVRNRVVRQFFPHPGARPYLYRTMKIGFEIWRGDELLGHSIDAAAARLCDITLAERGGMTLQVEPPAGHLSTSASAG